MAAPAAAAAIPVAITAASAAKPVLQGLFADLVTIRTQKPRRGKPQEIVYHINPGAIGVTAVGLGLALWLCQLRLRPQVTEDGHVSGITLGSRAGFAINLAGSGMGEDSLIDYVSPVKDPLAVAKLGSPLGMAIGYTKDPTNAIVVASPIGVLLRFLGVL